MYWHIEIISNLFNSKRDIKCSLHFITYFFLYFIKLNISIIMKQKLLKTKHEFPI